MILRTQPHLAYPTVHHCWYMPVGVPSAVFDRVCRLEGIRTAHIGACSRKLQLEILHVGVRLAQSMPVQFGLLQSEAYIELSGQLGQSRVC